MESHNVAEQIKKLLNENGLIAAVHHSGGEVKVCVVPNRKSGVHKDEVAFISEGYTDVGFWYLLRRILRINRYKPLK